MQHHQKQTYTKAKPHMFESSCQARITHESSFLIPTSNSFGAQIGITSYPTIPEPASMMPSRTHPKQMPPSNLKPPETSSAWHVSNMLQSISLNVRQTRPDRQHGVCLETESETNGFDIFLPVGMVGFGPKSLTNLCGPTS